jgi:hypothetical protein
MLKLTKPPSLPLATRVTVEQREQMEKLAADKDTTVSRLLRRVVTNYLDEQQKTA